jgi:hypothetical protein
MAVEHKGWDIGCAHVQYPGLGLTIVSMVDGPGEELDHLPTFVTVLFLLLFVFIVIVIKQLLQLIFEFLEERHLERSRRE